MKLIIFEENCFRRIVACNFSGQRARRPIALHNMNNSEEFVFM